MYTAIRDMAQQVTSQIGVDSVIYALAVVCPRYQPLMKQTMVIYGDSPDNKGTADSVA